LAFRVRLSTSEFAYCPFAGRASIVVIELEDVA
jgi:hypothetical protein